MLREFRVEAEELAKLKAGDTIGVECSRSARWSTCTGTTIGKGFAGVIKRHHFSSQPRDPRQLGFAQHAGLDRPGQRPGPRVPGQAHGRAISATSAHDAEPEGRARRRRAPAAAGQGRGARRRRRDVIVRPREVSSAGAAGEAGGGEAAAGRAEACAKPAASLRRRRTKGRHGTENGRQSGTARHVKADAMFGREYNEALVHQVVVAYQANARQRHARAEGPRRRSTTRPRSRGARRAPAVRAPA